MASIQEKKKTETTNKDEPTFFFSVGMCKCESCGNRSLNLLKETRKMAPIQEKKNGEFENFEIFLLPVNKFFYSTLKIKRPEPKN